MRTTLRNSALAVCLVTGALVTPGASAATTIDLPAQAAPDRVDVSKLPRCAVKPWKGFETAAEADAIPADAPVCLSPQDRVVTRSAGRNGPAPASPSTSQDGYYHNGPATLDRYKGVEATFQVTNAAVDHTGLCCQFVVSRVMALAYPDSNWLEAGWAEHSEDRDDDTAYVYTYTDVNNPDHTWRFFPGYSLSRSRYYTWRVDRCYVGPATVETCAYIFWGGEWNLLTHGDYGCTVYASGTDNQRCYGHALTEIYSENGSISIATGNSVDWLGVKVRKGTSWYSLSTAYDVKVWQTSPYVVCWQAMYHDFSVSRYSC